MDVAMAEAELDRLGVAHVQVRADDPLGRRPGEDVVIAARRGADGFVHVVGSTFAWPEAAR
jgi:hypothetical protein